MTPAHNQTDKARPITIFISYSHVDSSWQKRVRKYLQAALPSFPTVEIWDDTDIEPGQNMSEELQSAVERASIAVLLITPEYLTSSYLATVEIPHLLSRSREQLRLVPILVEQSAWHDIIWLREIFMLPRPLAPLSATRGSKLTSTLKKVAKEIVDLLPDNKQSILSPLPTDLHWASPVYLLSLTVENIRCFAASQTIDLSDGKGRPAPWTVILGNNGVGKTTLLRCLASIDSTISSVFLQEARLLIRNVDPLVSPTERSVNVSPPHSHIAGIIYSGKRLNDSSPNHSIPANSIQVDFIHSEWYPDERRIVKLNRVNDLICYGYGAARRMAESALSAELSAEHSASLFSEDVALQNAEEWLLQSDYAANVSSTIRDKARGRLEQVKSLLTDLLPDVDEIRVRYPDKRRKQATVEFKTPYGWVNIKQLSLGYRTLTAWMVDLARHMFERYPDSKQPITEPAIVLVDEIDLHLHPSWQRTLMQFLTSRFPSTQFIVTAHSPLVVQAAARANIVLLRQEDDHVEIINEAAQIRGWRVDQLLTSDLFNIPSSRGPELDPLLEERAAILSQGDLTTKDLQRLEDLESQIGRLPTAETPEDMEAMDIIREAAALLKSAGGKRS